MNNNQFKLEKEELKLMSYELSPEFLKKTINAIQENFNKVFKNYIKIAKFLQHNKKETLKDISEQIIKSQTDFLEAIKLYKVIVNILNCDINSSDIYIQFDSLEEFNKFKEKLHQRKKILVQYKQNMIDLEKINRRLTSTLEKISLCNIINPE